LQQLLTQPHSEPDHQERQDLQQQQEQMDLERAVNESERDYIIKSQKDDYKQSLCHDREKMNRKRHRLEFLKNRFESEKINNDQHFTTIAFHLPPDGKRLIKKVPRTVTTKELYWFVEWVQINPENNYDIPDNFVLKQVYGGVEIPENDTLSSLGLDFNGVVVVGEILNSFVIMVQVPFCQKNTIEFPINVLIIQFHRLSDKTVEVEAYTKIREMRMISTIIVRNQLRHKLR